MAKKTSSKKSLKSLFSKREASPDGTAEKDADRSEGDKKKFKLFKIRTKSTAPEKGSSEELQARSHLDSSQTANYAETWTDHPVFKNKSSLYGTAPRSKVKDISSSELDLHKPKKFATLSFALKKRKKKYDDSMSKSTFVLHVPEPEESSLYTTPLHLSRGESDKFKTKRMLSMSQPELETSNVFDIPSPPPVADNRSDSSFPALNQSKPPVPFVHAETKAPPTGLDHADVPREARRAPIATIPELQMEDVSSEENISAPEITPLHSSVTPTAAARTEGQATPIGPAEQPQVSLSSSDHEGAVAQSLVLDVVPQNSCQPSATTEAPTADATEPLHHSRPEEDSGEISGPEATAPTATSSAARPQKSVANQDEVYGALYDSLFPQSFTSEVLSSLSTPPAPIFTEGQHSKTVVRIIEDRTERNTSLSAPAAAAVDGPTDPTHPTDAYTGRTSGTAASRLTVSQTEADSHKDSDVHRRPPSSLHSHFDTSSSVTQSARCFSPKEDTPRSLPQISAPPVFDCGTAPGGDAHVTDSVPTLTRVRLVVRDQVSSQAASPSPVPDKKSAKCLECKTEKPAAPADMDGFLSPTYLSMGSDDGSVVDVYYSAEEDNAESGDDEMFTMDEGGQIGDRWLQQGGCSGADVSTRKEGTFRGIIVLKSEEGKKEEGGHSCAAPLRDKRASADVMEAPEKEEGKEMREQLLAKPVQQVDELMVCHFVPPSTEKHGQPEDSPEIWARKLEKDAPPNSEQHSFRQPLDDLAHKHTVFSYDAREEVITARSPKAEERVSIIAPAENDTEGGRNADGSCVASAAGDTTALLRGSVTHTGSAVEHNRVPPSAEWVDTITQSTGRTRNPQPEVSVQLTGTHQTDTGTLSRRSEHPAGARLDPSPGSESTSGTTPLGWGHQPTQPDWTYKMYPGYSSLNTTLSLKNSSSSPEDDSKRFHKVSLIGGAVVDGGGLDARSTAATDNNGGEYKWKNRFEGVSQYKPPRSQDSSLSDSSKPTACNYLDTTSSLSSHALEHNATSGNRLSNSEDVYRAVDEHRDELRSSPEWEEPAAPVEREGAPLRLKSVWQESAYNNTLREEDDDDEHFTGVFQATLVELDSDPVAAPSTPPASPDSDSPSQFDMDNLVDTLKSMGPAMRPRTSVPRPPAPVLMSSLPPIVEDASSPASMDVPDIANMSEALEQKPIERLNGLYTLPPELGLRSTRDTRSLLDLMKQNQQELSPSKGPVSPLRTSNGTMIRASPESLVDGVQSQNENGLIPTSSLGSRLDNSVIFGRSATFDQKLENKAGHRSLFRASSLPDVPFSSDRLSVGSKELEPGAKTDSVGHRFERFSILLNASASGSLNGVEDGSARISRAPQASIGSPPSSNSPSLLLSPTGSIELHRPFASPESTLAMFRETQVMGVGTGRVSTPILQRSFSSEGSVGLQPTSLFNSIHREAPLMNQEPPPERNLASKYRAFPDAYLTKEKDHGKLNPRPGKMYIFDRPGMCGKRFEVRSDVVDATSWELQDTISIRVVRGGWVLYEKPNFKGEKIALDEGDIEITSPFSPPEPQQNGHEEGAQEGPDNQKFIIGSIRRAVRDYSVPEISLFPEENAEGKKVIFRDTSDDARIFGQPIKANSIIISAGLWLVFAHPSFQGAPRVLEVGGYSNPAAWGVDQPYVGSVHPLKIGEPRLENASEPKLVIYDKPYFSGKSRTITNSMRDFMTRTDSQQTTFMYNVGSLKVLGGIWVGYEKEGYRGHQYLLEEGEYHDWRVWGGCDSELRSVRVIRADLSAPFLVMFELPFDDGEGEQDENTFEVTEAIPDVELFNYKTNTRSIHVVSGAWIAYSHVDYSGHQYILEKGFYNNCADWGSQDNRICSLQPILMALGSKVLNEVILYAEPDFQGECQVFDNNQEAVSEKFLTKSCRVSGGSWVVYEEENYSGSLYVLSEGDYPNLSSMGCPSDFIIHSVKAVPVMFTVPSISLFSLECLEGREITTETEITSMVEEGFNNHILSVRVNSGCWVICEHSNYRGRQFFLEPIEITNWLKFSSLQTVGSLFPVRQRRRFFRIKNKERGHFMSIQGGVDEMKSGRVVVSAQVEPMSDIWYYQDGLVKNKLISTMSLQVMGTIEPAAKAVLWSETRQPVQMWTTQMNGLIHSVTFPGMVLDVKGGKTYDKDHVVIMSESEERPSQQWEIELL